MNRGRNRGETATGALGNGAWNACTTPASPLWYAAAVSDAVPATVDASGRRCTKCGAVKPIASFGVDRKSTDGVNRRCRECCRLSDRRVRASQIVASRVDRAPVVLGLSDADDVSTAVLGVLRERYNGRPVLLLDDLRRTMADADPADRLNAMLTLLALRELAGLSRSIAERARALEELRRAPPD